MAKNIEFMGAVFPDVPSIRLSQYGGGLVSYDDTTDANATASDIAQGKTAYVNGVKITGTASGGGGGGASNVVTGTFTTPSTEGQANTVSLPYTGNGYPIAFMIFPKDCGAGLDTLKNTTRTGGMIVGWFSGVKVLPSSPPDFTAESYTDESYCYAFGYRKTSATDKTWKVIGLNSSRHYGPGNANSSERTTVKFNDAQTLNYYVVGSSNYGLAPSFEYAYYILYSE